MPKPKVLFICLGNSCRSIMAEALARHRCGDRWEAASAGINPLGFVAPETLVVLAEMGVSPAGLYSKGLNEIDLREYRLVINLSDHSLQGLIPPDGAVRVRHRSGAGPLRVRSGGVPPEPGRHPSGDHPGTLPGRMSPGLNGARNGMPPLAS